MKVAPDGGANTAVGSFIVGEAALLCSASVVTEINGGIGVVGGVPCLEAVQNGSAVDTGVIFSELGLLDGGKGFLGTDSFSFFSSSEILDS